MEGLEAKIRKLSRAIESKVVSVGWVDGNKTAAEAYAHLKEKKATGKNQPPISHPASLATIARTLHFGRMPGVTSTGRRYGYIPARPFMDVAGELLTKKMPKILKVLLPRYLSGRMTERQFMQTVAERGVDSVKEAINMREKYQALAPATLKSRKHGGDQPLVDTGTLRNSVDYEIKNR